MAEEAQSSRERVAELARRRRRSAFAKSLVVFLAAATGLCLAFVFGWGKFKKTRIFLDLTRDRQASHEPDGPNLAPDGGFHIVEEGYWSLFDLPAAEAAPARQPGPASGTPGEAKAPARPDQAGPPPRDEVADAEGLEIHKMDDEGPYTVSGDMGGLIAVRVGVWRSPNKLGTGKIAFYCEHFEKAKVTHWARNLLGFRVYRVVKEGRAGWVLGNCLLDKDGEPFK